LAGIEVHDLHLVVFGEIIVSRRLTFRRLGGAKKRFGFGGSVVILWVLSGVVTGFARGVLLGRVVHW
jgi:hypothetical protein